MKLNCFGKGRLKLLKNSTIRVVEPLMPKFRKFVGCRKVRWCGLEERLLVGRIDLI